MISFTIVIGLIGLIVGSFLNVVIYRLPIMLQTMWKKECTDFLGKKSTEEESIFNLALPRSHCPKCKHTIPAFYNVPVLSYLFLRGKCPFCKIHISWQYPLVEALSCIVAVYVAYHFGATWQTAMLILLSWSLIVMVGIDCKHMLIPDIITIPLLWVGLVINAFHTFTSPTSAIIGACAGYLFLWTVAWLFKQIRKVEGMGHGDFKLLAMFGAWLGWQQLPCIILVSSTLGAIVGITLIIFKKHSMKKPLPFGPFIALAGWIATIWGQQIISWYLHIGGIV